MLAVDLDRWRPGLLFREPKRVCITGSRTFLRKHLELARPELLALEPDSIIVHGGQGERDWRGEIVSGADLLVAELAQELGFTTEEWKADWDNEGLAAGPNRNIRMLKSGIVFVIAFWDGRTTGTAHTMRHARKMGIPVRVVEFDS